MRFLDTDTAMAFHVENIAEISFSFERLNETLDIVDSEFVKGLNIHESTQTQFVSLKDDPRVRNTEMSDCRGERLQSQSCEKGCREFRGVIKQALDQWDDYSSLILDHLSNVRNILHPWVRLLTMQNSSAVLPSSILRYPNS
jgi:hypothetical protein